MKHILRQTKLLAASLVLAAGISFGFMAPVAAQGGSGQAKQDICAGVNLGGGTCNNNGNELTNVIKFVVTLLSIIAGVAAVIMLIVGGIKFITSSGDASKVAGAKSSIIYAIVGLIVVALSQFIVQFVLGRATTP